MYNQVVDNKTIVLHIFAYVIPVVAWIITACSELKADSRIFVILDNILLVIIIVSDLILAFIINKILNKIRQQDDVLNYDILTQSDELMPSEENATSFIYQRSS